MIVASSLETAITDPRITFLRVSIPSPITLLQHQPLDSVHLSVCESVNLPLCRVMQWLESSLPTIESCVRKYSQKEEKVVGLTRI